MIIIITIIIIVIIITIIIIIIIIIRNPEFYVTLYFTSFWILLHFMY